MVIQENLINTMIQDNPISLGYWGDPKLTKKLSTKGRAVKALVTL